MIERTLKLIILDIVACSLSLILAFCLRFDFQIPKEFHVIVLFWSFGFSIVQILIFYISQLYHRIWRYTSLVDLYAILRAVIVSSAISFMVVFLFMPSGGYPRSVFLIFLLLNFLFSAGLRLSIRVFYSGYNTYYKRTNDNVKNLLLIGAGKTGEKIAREILSTSLYKLTGFIDDDKAKHSALIHGKRVFCSVSDIENLYIDYDEILITAPSATGNQMRFIVEACKKTNKPYYTLPGLTEILNEDISLKMIRDVSYSDLLGREEVKLDMKSIVQFIKGKRVLITGAGGSIGSELVKQCLLFEPSEIICLDHSEEKIFNLEQDFISTDWKTILKFSLCTINSLNEIKKIFLDNKPHIVFHAAAYKHVPIQENHPWTAVKTNIGGTYNLVKLSHENNVGAFVLVSTDKAVNPANVMGATKRVAEKIIQSFNIKSKTRYVAVRFGNVLGSSGSAIPTFQKQINKGGPITITHPEMTRYFMSIQEASQLILQCGSFGVNREIFLLEMGSPIKILDMAKDLIRLSGIGIDIDIPIVYTGLRPGEKLYEELILSNEKKVKTQHKKIVILDSSNTIEPWQSLSKKIVFLLLASDDLNVDKILTLLKEIIPNYKSKQIDMNSFKNDYNDYDDVKNQI